jgi:hypothetical protein
VVVWQLLLNNNSYYYGAMAYGVVVVVVVVVVFGTGGTVGGSGMGRVGSADPSGASRGAAGSEYDAGGADVGVATSALAGGIMIAKPDE